MVCQIYSVSTVEEAFNLIEAGVDYLGFNPTEMTNSTGFISIARAKEIIEAVGDRAKTVVIALENDAQVIMDKVDILKPDVLHISGNEFEATPELVKELKAKHPFMRIMQAVQVVDESAITKAYEYGKFVDYLILDSGISEGKGIGASGKVHDWNISREIVKSCGVPVIMAGGLSPENVADAVALVKPWGVDSLTHTDKILSDGSRIKDIDKVRLFCENARR